jgi:hypothetical protein
MFPVECFVVEEISFIALVVPEQNAPKVQGPTTRCIIVAGVVLALAHRRRRESIHYHVMGDPGLNRHGYGQPKQQRLGRHKMVDGIGYYLRHFIQDLSLNLYYLLYRNVNNPDILNDGNRRVIVISRRLQYYNSQSRGNSNQGNQIADCRRIAGAHNTTTSLLLDFEYLLSYLSLLQYERNQPFKR